MRGGDAAPDRRWNRQSIASMRALPEPLPGTEHENDFIVVRPKPDVVTADDIADDHIAVLRLKLTARFLDEILRLGGKADQELIALFLADFRENIGSWGPVRGIDGPPSSSSSAWESRPNDSRLRQRL